MNGTNAIEMLLSDHQKVKDLFQQYQQADAGQKETLARQILQEIEVHSRLEEEIFYPAVQTKADQQGQERVSHSFEEHRQVNSLIQELRALTPGAAPFETRFTELMRNVQHHIQEEESELLPRAQQQLGGDVERLAGQMAQRKQELMATST